MLHKETGGEYGLGSVAWAPSGSAGPTMAATVALASVDRGYDRVYNADDAARRRWRGGCNDHGGTGQGPEDDRGRSRKRDKRGEREGATTVTPLVSLY